jgi:hypothetical protein
MYDSVEDTVHKGWLKESLVGKGFGTDTDARTVSYRDLENQPFGELA